MKYFSYQGKRPFYFRLAYIWVLSNLKFRYFRFGNGSILYIVHQGIMGSFWYEFPEKEQNWHYKKFFFQYLKNPEKIDEFSDFIQAENDKVINTLKKIELTVKKLSDNEIFKIYLRAADIYMLVSYGISVVRRLDEGGAKFLEQVKFKTKKDFDIYLLATTDKLSYLNQEELEFLRVIKNSKKDTLSNLIKKHLKKWSWTGCSYADEPPNTYEHFLKVAKKWITSPKKLEQRLKELNSSRQNIIKNRSALLKKLDIKDKNFSSTIHLLQESSFLKDYMRAMVGQLVFYSTPILNEIAKRKRVSFDTLNLLTLPELKTFLDKNIIPDKRTLEDRNEFCLIFPEQSKVKILYSKEAKEIEQEYFKESGKKDIKEFKGNIAYPGKVRSRVKIIESLNDAEKFKQGDILVAHNTTPELVIIMKKAAAIVTNEGGITSHAAIVSRELKIPCVIATKIATKVLKDGDMVEVDANEGVVRKIK